MLSLYRDPDMTIELIATELGCHPRTVHRIIAANGTPSRRDTPA